MQAFFFVHWKRLSLYLTSCRNQAIEIYKSEDFFLIQMKQVPVDTETIVFFSHKKCVNVQKIT